MKKGEILNEHFSTVGEKLASEFNLDQGGRFNETEYRYIQYADDTTMYVVARTRDEIAQMLNKALKYRKSRHPDKTE